MSRKSKFSHDREILHEIAKGPWADFWANGQEEQGRSFSQENIYDICPEPPRAAWTWARETSDRIVELNGGLSLESLYLAARHAGFSHNREEFGFYLGCQVSGMGIRWNDDLTPDSELKIEVPQHEFYI